MSKRLLCILVLVPVLCGFGCSTDPDVCLDLATCTGVTFEDGMDLFDVIGDVLLDGTFNPTTGAYSTSFGGVNVNGMVSEDTGDGDGDFEVGETFVATYTLSGGSSGSGSFDFTYTSASRIDISDNGTPTIGSGGCTLSLEDVRVYGDPEGGFLSGSIDFTTRSAGNNMDGTMRFNGTSIASVEVECDLVVPVDCTFDLNLVTFQVSDWGCGL